MIAHQWNVTPKEAIEIQKKLRGEVKIQPLKKKITTIAGADISFNKFEKEVYAGIIVWSYPDLREVHRSLVKTEANFPYIPGLLSFREIPALMKAWDGLKEIPDLLVVDGQGIAHPRRLGIATHFGILAEVPTIGCAKSLLTGTYEEPSQEAGSFSYIYDSHHAASEAGEIIGAAVRTKNKVKPVIISPGHLIGLEQSIEVMLACVQGYRLPETTRRVHDAVNLFRRANKGKLQNHLQMPLL